MNYHNIERANIENGDGVRCVIWVSGCDHNCPGCFNPETHDPNGGIPFDEDALDEIFNALDNSLCAGITFSGGDPLHWRNYDEILNICKIIKGDEKYKGKTIWVYSGMLIELLLAQRREILQYIDVLVDGRFMEDLASKEYHWAGSLNQRVINVPATYENFVLWENDNPMDEVFAEAMKQVMEWSHTTDGVVYHEPEQKEFAKANID